MKSEISVIIPTYNRALLLPFAIESVLTQTYAAAEIIVVDDGSTDDTREVVARYGDAVHYIHRPNGGIGAARNTGIEIARSRLIALLDSDDTWCAEKLAVQMRALEAHADSPLIFPHYRETDADGVPRSGAKPGFLASGVLAPTDVFHRIGPFSSIYAVGEFVDWMARANQLGIRSHLLAEVLFFRRVHAANTVTVNRAAYTDYARILKEKLDRDRAAARETETP